SAVSIPSRSAEESPPAHGLLRDWFQNAANSSNHLLPAFCLRHQLLPAGRSQPVVLRFAIVLRRSPERRDPAAVLEPVKRRVERSMFDLQNIFGTSLDRMRDRVTVSGSQRERLKNQHIEGALRHFTLQRRVTSRHP